MTWLSKIEALKPGDACEFRYPARREWHAGVVVVNGGSGYWTVRLTEEYIDDEIGRRVDPFIEANIFIEHVRLPGQTDAWPRSQ